VFVRSLQERGTGDGTEDGDDADPERAGASGGAWRGGSAAADTTAGGRSASGDGELDDRRVQARGDGDICRRRGTDADVTALGLNERVGLCGSPERLEAGAGGLHVDCAEHASVTMRRRQALFAVEPNGLRVVGDGEVPGGRIIRSRVYEFLNVARVESTGKGFAGVGEGRLGDGVVSGGAGKLEGDD